MKGDVTKTLDQLIPCFAVLGLSAHSVWLLIFSGSQLIPSYCKILIACSPERKAWFTAWSEIPCEFPSHLGLWKCVRIFQVATIVLFFCWLWYVMIHFLYSFAQKLYFSWVAMVWFHPPHDIPMISSLVAPLSAPGAPLPSILATEFGTPFVLGYVVSYMLVTMGCLGERERAAGEWENGAGHSWWWFPISSDCFCVFCSEVTCVLKSWEVVFFLCVCVFPRGDFGVIFGRMFKLWVGDIMSFS